MKRGNESILIKKYGNRRLYDTHHSRYVTLGEVAELISAGADVRVIDAKSNADLTQATLMQIILDRRGAARLVPVDLLTQLVRMDDEALAEFLGRYVAFALEMYTQVKQGAVAPWNPLAPFAPPLEAELEPEPEPDLPTEPMRATSSEVAELRRELAGLKQTLAHLARAKK